MSKSETVPIALKDVGEPFPTVRGTEKEAAAKQIGKTLIHIFGASIGAVLLIFLIIVLMVDGDPEKLKGFTQELIALLEGIGKFVSSVFAPFLAFVLGYYFRGDTSESNEK